MPGSALILRPSTVPAAPEDTTPAATLNEAINLLRVLREMDL